MNPIQEELQAEVPGVMFNRAIKQILADQNSRSRKDIYQGLRLLAEKFPRKRINITMNLSYFDVDDAKDRNCIQIFVSSAPKWENHTVYINGVTPDNVLEDNKVVHGKSAVLINDNWITLTRGQRNTWVDRGIKDGPSDTFRDKFKENVIRCENPVDLGFAIHNQIFIFLDLFDSKSNSGQIFLYTVTKALTKLSFQFAESLPPEEIAKYIYDIRTIGFKSRINELEKMTRNLMNEQTQLLDAYTTAVRRNETCIQELTALRTGKEGKDSVLVRLAKEVQSLIDKKMYVEFYIEREPGTHNNIFCAVTNRILVLHKDEVYDFRYFTVKITIGPNGQINNQSIKFDHPEINVNGFCHPHSGIAGGTNSICWGAIQTEIANCCGKGELMRIMDICYFFLQNYAPNNKPFIQIEKFKEAKQVEVIPYKEFQKRPAPTTEDYKAWRDNIRSKEEPTGIFKVLNEVGLMDAATVVCENCREEEHNCTCDTPYRLVER